MEHNDIVAIEDEYIILTCRKQTQPLCRQRMYQEYFAVDDVLSLSLFKQSTWHAEEKYLAKTRLLFLI
jgi:hypothetical protein